LSSHKWPGLITWHVLSSQREKHAREGERRVLLRAPGCLGRRLCHLMGQQSSPFENNYFTKMCSASGLIDFVCHSTVGSRVKKRDEHDIHVAGESDIPDREGDLYYYGHPAAFAAALPDAHAFAHAGVPRS